MAPFFLDCRLLLPLTAVAVVALTKMIPLLLRLALGPGRLRAAQRIPRTPQVEPTPAETLSPEIRDVVHRAVRQFAAEGFEVAANVSLAGPDADPDGVALELLLVNRATGDLGSLTAVAHWPTGARAFVLAVRSLFADGSSVVTACSDRVGVFPNDPRADEVAFGWSADDPRPRDARALCEAHRRRMRWLGKDGLPRVAPAPGEEMTFWPRQWERELERSERTGRHVRAADVNRLTWKGACLAAWGQSEPLRTWRVRRRARRGRRAWAALGMNDWAPPSDPTTSDPTLADPRPADYGTPSPLVATPPALSNPPPAGEIHFEPAGEGITVRVGAPTTFQFITGRWIDLVTMAALAAYAGYHFLAARQLADVMARQLPAAAVLPNNVLPLMMLALLAAALLVLDAYCFLRDLAFARRGPTVLSADRTGLSYHNVATWRCRGRVAREDLDMLSTRPLGWGIFGQAYQLELRRRGVATPEPILVGTDVDALATIHVAIARAMGILPPAPDTSQPPDVAAAA